MSFPMNKSLRIDFKTTKLSEMGGTTLVTSIPKDVCKQLGLEKGKSIFWIPDPKNKKRYSVMLFDDALYQEINDMVQKKLFGE